jgi:hypothetical protein
LPAAGAKRPLVALCQIGPDPAVSSPLTRSAGDISAFSANKASGGLLSRWTGDLMAILIELTDFAVSEDHCNFQPQRNSYGIIQKAMNHWIRFGSLLRYCDIQPASPLVKW